MIAERLTAFIACTRMQPTKFALQVSLVLLVAGQFCISCTSRPTPAPVVELYQGKDFYDFKKDGFDGKHYVVQKGDTLFSIAWYTGNDYRDLANINGISKPFSIYPGQQLLLEKDNASYAQGTQKSPGQTKDIKPKRTVDRPQKQAYGESNKGVNKDDKRSKTIEFPERINKWIWPAQGKLISQFSLSEQGNKGIEIGGHRGNDIVAAADGKVVYTGNALRGYGQLIIIKHSDSFLSAYAHNDAVFVNEQQWIKAGQKIASMGSTGTDQVKLRFEVRYKGKSVNPMKYLPTQ
ncbi:peptidoglycan DD-metalloendopeptidase family protein [Aliiglaciecola sp. LCG003]|uniref:peptidoglycan DD-metalloendopeptidase family protein n=1 Tax=Aliiglaciecola sp. LCG003 TaxID=3053655 RepID=UPI0025740DFC|nr:peptidoglycan DD-metalloendopeptidase family protein [Aliiglaciecola sp. LCG003]WJG09045.1 peptidoglycan DD-metalloendopeptidase family protein [Aliiglaciecola sp. LCG003]